VKEAVAFLAGVLNMALGAGMQFVHEELVVFVGILLLVPR